MCKIYCIISFFILVLLNACQKLIDVPAKDQIQGYQNINTVYRLKQLLASVYANYPTYHNTFSILGGDYLLSDKQRLSDDVIRLYDWNGSQIQHEAQTIWTEVYKCISDINVLLRASQRVRVSNVEDQQELANVTAQAKLLKSMAYLQLLEIFSDNYQRETTHLGVVFRDMPEYSIEPRATQLESYERILKDLNDVISDIQLNTSSTVLGKDAALFLKSKVCLYQNKWQEALELSDVILQEYDINSSLLQSDYHALWIGKPTLEILFQKENYNRLFYEGLSHEQLSADAALFVRVQPDFVPMPTDFRYKLAIPYPSKYPVKRTSDMRSFVKIIRRVESCFIAIEACLRMEDLQKTVYYLNKLRTIRGLELYKGEQDVEHLRSEFFEQYAYEFVGEGYIWFLNKRWRNASRQMKILADDYRWIFPIPNQEVSASRGVVTQNRGW